MNWIPLMNRRRFLLSSGTADTPGAGRLFSLSLTFGSRLCRVFGASFRRLRGEAEGIRMLLRLRSSGRDGGRSLRLVVLKKRSHLRLGRMATVWIGRASGDSLRPGYR